MYFPFHGAMVETKPGICEDVVDPRGCPHVGILVWDSLEFCMHDGIQTGGAG